MSLPLRDMQYSQPGAERNWDIMPDGKRLLGLSPLELARGQINIVTNGTKELEEKLRK